MLYVICCLNLLLTECNDFLVVLHYTKNKLTSYLDHTRVAECSASSGFNSVVGEDEYDSILYTSETRRWGCRSSIKNKVRKAVFQSATYWRLPFPSVTRSLPIGEKRKGRTQREGAMPSRLPEGQYWFSVVEVGGTFPLGLPICSCQELYWLCQHIRQL